MSVRPRIVLDEKEEILGSSIRITIVVSEDLRSVAQTVLRAAFAECHRLDEQYSRFRKDNQLSVLNLSFHEWQQVSPELFFLLGKGLEIFQTTGGAFNLGVKALLEKWGYDSNYSFQPDENPASNLPKKDAVNFLTSPPYELLVPNKVKLFYPIELGGLGKGYALDLMFGILKDFPDFCVDAGGDLYAQGSPQEGKHWDVFFEHPVHVTMALGQVHVDRFFAAASNPLKRKWAGKYHHLVDPVGQKPADQMLAVYTQAQTGLLADAYSTALFVLGYEKAKILLPNIPVEAMLVSPQGEIYRTAGFKGELFVTAE